MLVIMGFVLATGLAFLANGRRAFDWSDKGLRRSVLVNMLLHVSYGVIAGGAVFAMANGFYNLLVSSGLPFVPRALWAGVPAWMLCLIMVVLVDLADYCSHRLMHTKLLWPIHGVHHSDPDMNWTTTFRVHIFQPILMKLFYVVFFTFAGFDAVELTVVSTLTFLYNAFVHINADIKFDGLLGKVLVSPRYHRWHHADTPEAYNKNFANIFAIWDHLFGTFHMKGRYEGRLGFENSPEHDIRAILLFPFAQWRRDWKAWRAAAVAKPVSAAFGPQQQAGVPSRI